MGPLLRRFVSSTFEKKRITPHSDFSRGTVKLLLFDQSEPRLTLGHKIGTKYFLGKVLKMFTI